MGQPRRAADELAEWARRRAPELVARAEVEAVRALRDALVAAATERRPEIARPPDPAPSPLAPASGLNEPEPGELLWAYCVLRAGEPHPPNLRGVDEHGPVECEQADGLAALVSRVPRAQFAAEPLRRNLNELNWLEQVARRHEAVLDATLEAVSLVPLRMCTLYESADSVRAMLKRERGAFIEALAAVDGRVEWAIKVLVDQRALREAAMAQASPSDVDPAPESEGEGSGYMRRRRQERETSALTASLATELAERVHARLQDWAIGGTTRPPQNRELSGHLGEMVLNAAYLVDRERTDELRELVAELEEHHRELGVRIELTGPWPPYNFVPGTSGTALA